MHPTAVTNTKEDIRTPATIESLPTEILTIITEKLGFDDIVPFSYKEREMDKAAQYNLRQLCLVCSRMLPVARHRLYHSIFISGPTVMILLYRSLLDTPELGKLVREVGLTDWHFLTLQQLELLQSLDDAELCAYVSDTQLVGSASSEIEVWLLYIAFFKVLDRTPELVTLTMHVPPQLDSR